ncbi:hypothetical protein FB565_002468 [Actinoplanes lutulentus]|uniref:Uncharacterized protein n=1 Tax=Actinoplanes lutulentus TaxID=1287878 RepID=A0A327ZFT9_9ACTN|nr:hypothetical protein [Actinoplanes lutulentus]RAK38335.1 hypothetical protein B0I29_105283 [Actinoplanes lutulentus]
MPLRATSSTRSTRRARACEGSQQPCRICRTPTSQPSRPSLVARRPRQARGVRRRARGVWVGEHMQTRRGGGERTQNACAHRRSGGDERTRNGCACAHRPCASLPAGPAPRRSKRTRIRRYNRAEVVSLRRHVGPKLTRSRRGGGSGVAVCGAAPKVVSLRRHAGQKLTRSGGEVVRRVRAERLGEGRARHPPVCDASPGSRGDDSARRTFTIRRFEALEKLRYARNPLKRWPASAGGVHVRLYSTCGRALSGFWERSRTNLRSGYRRLYLPRTPPARARRHDERRDRHA